MKLLIGTKTPNLANKIKERGKYDVVGVTDSVNELNSFLATRDVDALLVTKNIQARTRIEDFLVRLKINFPTLRIIYFTPDDLSYGETTEGCALLVDNGIYDIHIGRGVTIDTICDLLDNPKTKEDCRYIEDAFLNRRTRIEKEAVLNKKTIQETGAQKRNIFVVTSVKPGTGKSFISSNLALTLAKYALNKPDGTRPRVLLVEGDLQTLSLSTLFGIKDEFNNLRVAIESVKEFLKDHTHDDLKSPVGDATKESLLMCCKNIEGYDNLYLLEGHDLSTMDLARMNPQEYYYLIDVLADEFDIVIVDANSSLQHKTTDPLFQLANTIYFIFTTDYGNLKLNEKYYKMLQDIGVIDKTRFILNKTMSKEQERLFRKEFNYSDEEIIGKDLSPSYKMPLVDYSIMCNAIYNHTPIAYDKSFATLPARMHLVEIANEIYPLGGVDDMLKEVEDLRKAYGKKIKNK